MEQGEKQVGAIVNSSNHLRVPHILLEFPRLDLRSCREVFVTIYEAPEKVGHCKMLAINFKLSKYMPELPLGEHSSNQILTPKTWVFQSHGSFNKLQVTFALTFYAQ